MTAPVKTVQDIAQEQELVEVVGSTMYEGYAAWGTLKSEAGWLIVKSTLGGGGISLVERPNGVSTQNQIWDDRATISTYAV